MMEEDKTSKLIHDGIIGSDVGFRGPFGDRCLVYADWTASGRALIQVENYIRKTVLPLYANTHTETSITGSFTTSLRENARSAIMTAVSAGSGDVVLFTGNGSTAAINDFLKLIEIEKACKNCRAGSRPLVLTSGYEHHSNILPWRECGAEVLEIRESPLTGAVDLAHLNVTLKAHRGKRAIIGSFSAGSNVTGICSDVKAIAILLHQYGALACFDFACVAPYLGIEMNWTSSDPGDQAYAYLDAAYVSAHKFAGGVGATGLLIAKKNILTRSIPISPGGGTVIFVTSTSQQYLDDIVPKEEAGTPNIIGSIRAGLALQIKSMCGVEWIVRREDSLVRKLRKTLPLHPNLVVLGPPSYLSGSHRLPIISFLIKCGNRFLHHAFVAAVLNDVYGIQTRSGCMCAGPYVERLFGTSVSDINKLTSHLHDKQYLKPGFCRLSLVYFNSDEEVEFIISALLEVADHAWKLLPQYLFDKNSGNWMHREHRFPHPCLSSFSLEMASTGNQDDTFCDGINNSSEYYANILLESRGLYQTCHSAYCEDAYYRTGVPDYESQLYSGIDPKYCWNVFPKDVVLTALSQPLADWKFPHYKTEAFIRPDFYWPAVLDYSDQSESSVECGCICFA